MQGRIHGAYGTRNHTEKNQYSGSFIVSVERFEFYPRIFCVELPFYYDVFLFLSAVHFCVNRLMDSMSGIL